MEQNLVSLEQQFKQSRADIIKKSAIEITDIEALDTMLRFVWQRSDTSALAYKFLVEYGGFTKFCRMVSYKDLMKIAGINAGMAKKLLCLCKLAQYARLNVDTCLSSNSVESSESVSKMLEMFFQGVKHEMVVLFILNADYKIVHYQVLGHGSIDHVSFDMFHIPDLVALYKGSNIILSHNHPQGSFLPSDDDIRTTERLFALCKSSGLDFVDHIIVSPNGSYSFQGTSLLEKIEQRVTAQALLINKMCSANALE